MSDWLTITPGLLDPTNSPRWKAITPAKARGFIASSINFKAFNKTTNWLGASYILTEEPVSAPSSFIFKGIVKPVGVNYCLAVRYINAQGLIVRYKLWSQGTEKLFFPVYSGQIILKNFVFEVWSVQDFNTSSQALGITFFTSLYSMAIDCCDTLGLTYTGNQSEPPAVPWIIQSLLDPFSAEFVNPDSLNQPRLISTPAKRFAENTSFTIAGWVLLNNRLSESYIASDWIGGGNENWFMGFYYPTFDLWYAVIRTPGNVDQNVFGPPLSIANNTWHYVALVHDYVNLKFRIYTDGVEGALVDSVGNKAAAGGAMAFGMRGGLGNFNGRLDEWAIWTRALTKAELDAIYNFGSPRAYDSLTDAQKVSMASYLDFASSTTALSPIDNSPYLVDIGKSKHPGGWDFINDAPYSGGVLSAPYVRHANRATLYP